jgi:hypothetical protein
MDSSDRFFCIIYSLVALVLIVLMISINMNSMHYAQVVENVTIKTGTNPMYVSCSINDSLGDDPVCVVLAHGLVKE